jgi:hypothetical protein
MSISWDKPSISASAPHNDALEHLYHRSHFSTNSAILLWQVPEFGRVLPYYDGALMLKYDFYLTGYVFAAIFVAASVRLVSLTNPFETVVEYLRRARFPARS